jgi:hypothetical protein
MTALVVAAAVAAAAPSFVFGREGGNVVPMRAAIYASGRVVVNGEARRPLTRTKVTALRRLAAAQHFSKLPRRIECPGVLPDIATLYVKVGRARTVFQHGSCNRRFNRVYAALAKAVGEP